MDARERWEELGRAFASAEGREQVAISVEMRQLEAAIAAQEAVEARLAAEAGGELEDPIVVGRLLLRELAGLVRVDPVLAREVWTELGRALCVES